MTHCFTYTLLYSLLQANYLTQSKLISLSHKLVNPFFGGVAIDPFGNRRQGISLLYSRQVTHRDFVYDFTFVSSKIGSIAHSPIFSNV